MRITIQITFQLHMAGSDEKYYPIRFNPFIGDLRIYLGYYINCVRRKIDETRFIISNVLKCF